VTKTAPTAANHDEDEADGRVFIEPRWPIALVVGLYIALTVTLRVTVPDRPHLGPDWLVPAIEILLLVALVLADPNHITTRSRWLRRAGIVLTSGLLVVTLVSTCVLIRDLIDGGKTINSADVLLASGALVWLGNVMVFSLLYWQLDSGGPLARYRGEHAYPDFLFPQQASPEFAPPGWRPKFPDYLILGLTTSTAFSPTDVMPMALWCKLTMALQAIIALTVVGLVIARAVNLFA
jgi:uncharacterized membrane protein